jgi:hypothetical protein
MRLTHIERRELDRKLGGILEIYEKFQGVDPRDVPMKIFPAVHYSMGGLWVDYERTASGGLVLGSPRKSGDQYPAPVCDWRMRLSVSRCQSAGREFAVELYLLRAPGGTGPGRTAAIAPRRNGR